MFSTPSIALLWLGVSLILFHQIIVASALFGEDESSAPVCRPFNKSSGMAELCGYNATDELTVQLKGQLDLDEFAAVEYITSFSRLFQPSCFKMFSLLHCEHFFPRCVSNVQGPFLPCKRVCHAFLSRCGEELRRNISESFYLWTRWNCNLLPEKDDPSTMDYRKRCFEPPGFKACDSKCDLKPLKCFPLVVPECQNLGYKFTIYPEKYQKGYMDMVKKDTNINTSCDVLERKMDCTTRWFPPCFKEEMLTGIICREDCLKFLQTNCSSSWKHVNCKFFPKRSSANDLVCKITGWVSDDWPGVFKKNKQSQQKGNLALMSIIGLLTSTV